MGLAVAVHGRRTPAVAPPSRASWWCRAPPAHSARPVLATHGETACGDRTHHRRFSQPETHSQWTGSGVLEDHWEIAQPRNREAPFVEGGFTQDRIVRPLVEAYHEAIGVYVKLTTSFDKLAVELFGFRFVEPMQPGGQPPIAAIRQDGQRDIDVHIEAHFTGQAIEVKEIDTDPQAVLYAVASSIADEQVPGTGVEVVRHHEGELGAS